MTALICIATIWLIGVVWFCREVIHSLRVAESNRANHSLPTMPRREDQRSGVEAGVAVVPEQPATHSQSVGAEGPFVSA